MALISETPHDERERILAQVFATGDRLVKYAENPGLLTAEERARAGELGVASAQQALKVAVRLDIDLNEIVAVNTDIEQLIEDIETRLRRENDPIETGPEAAEGYWRERADRAEGVIDQIDRFVNGYTGISPLKLDDVRSLLLAYYDAKSRD